MSFRDLQLELKKFDDLLKELDSAGNTCNNFTKKLTQADTVEVELNDKQWAKVQQVFRDLKSVLLKADKTCGNCINVLDSLHKEDNTHAEKKRKPDTHPKVGQKRFKNADPSTSSILPPGKKVAAKISKDKDLPEEMWILASVVRYIEEKHVYEVVDEDYGDESDPEPPPRKHHVLPPSCLLPLPDSPEKAKEFAKGTEILAMFPNTTSFYKAIVVQAPRGKKPYEYTLQFADDDDETGETPLRKVPATLCTSITLRLPEK